jgi:prevent-host-death family protein
MSELNVGIRELKARLSGYLRLMKNGQTILITEHGRPVARIIPVEETLAQRMQVLQKANLLAWSGKKVQVRQPAITNRQKTQVSDIIAEMRE